MIGQRLAVGQCLGRCRHCRWPTLLDLGDIGIEIFKAQRQLIGIEPFRSAPEPHALQLFDDLLEPFDLAVSTVDHCCHVTHQSV